MGWAVVRRLTAAELRAGCEALAAADSRLGALLARNGVPPLRLRPDGFATLVHLILQQQVSRASAQAVFDRLVDLTDGSPTGAAVTATHRDELRAIGFSHQKIEYVTDIARQIEDGSFDLAGLRNLDDASAISALEAQRGIGPWTASVYVLTALGRPDVWAPGDRALLVSLGRMLGSADVPSNERGIQIAEAWRPWRAVAARILWHDYAAAEKR